MSGQAKHSRISSRVSTDSLVGIARDSRSGDRGFDLNPGARYLLVE